MRCRCHRERWKPETVSPARSGRGNWLWNFRANSHPSFFKLTGWFKWNRPPLLRAYRQWKSRDNLWTGHGRWEH